MLTTDPGAGCQFVQRNTVCARLPSALGFAERFPIWVLTRLDPIEWMGSDREGPRVEWLRWTHAPLSAPIAGAALSEAPAPARHIQPHKCHSTLELGSQSLRASARSANRGVILNKKIFIANLKLSEVRALFKYFYNNCKDQSYNNGSTNAVRQKQER